MALGVSLPYALISFMFGFVNMSNAYFMTILKYLVPSLLMGFSFYLVADYVNKSVGLLEQGSGSPTTSKGEGNDDEEKEPLVATA